MPCHRRVSDPIEQPEHIFLQVLAIRWMLRKSTCDLVANGAVRPRRYSIHSFSGYGFPTPPIRQR